MILPNPVMAWLEQRIAKERTRLMTYILECPQCGTVCIKQRTKQRYCSPKCRMREHRKRHAPHYHKEYLDSARAAGLR